MARGAKTVGRGARSRCRPRLLLLLPGDYSRIITRILLVSSFVVLMFHVVVLDFLIMSHSTLVDFQVSGPAQRRTWVPIENHGKTIEKQSGTTRSTTEPCIWEGECPGGVAVVVAGSSCSCSSSSSSSRCSFVLVVAVVLAFVLRRSCHIKNVVLFEGDSILPLPGCLEYSGW